MREKGNSYTLKLRGCFNLTSATVAGLVRGHNLAVLHALRRRSDRETRHAVQRRWGLTRQENSTKVEITGIPLEAGRTGQDALPRAAGAWRGGPARPQQYGGVSQW